MKKTSLLLFLLLLYVPSFGKTAYRLDSVKSNTNSWLISAGYGRNSLQKIFTELHANHTATSSTGVFAIGVTHFIKPRLGISIIASYEQMAGNILYAPPIATYQKRVFDIVPKAVVIYGNSRNSKLQVYGTYGVGLLIFSEIISFTDQYYASRYVNGTTDITDPITSTHNGFGADFSIYPLCFSYGGTLRGFAEFGVGPQGLYHTGLSYQIR